MNIKWKKIMIMRFEFEKWKNTKYYFFQIIHKNMSDKKIQISVNNNKINKVKCENKIFYTFY